VLVAGMAGALLLARAVSDPELSERILQAAREHYTKAFTSQPGQWRPHRHQHSAYTNFPPEPHR